MLFLIPPTQHIAPSNFSPLTSNNGEEDTDERKEDSQGSSGGTSKTLCQKQQHKSNTLWKVNYKQQLLDVLKEKSEYNDNDKTFLLSLFPAFKKLKDDQK
jgi:hypothetical protein